MYTRMMQSMMWFDAHAKVHLNAARHVLSAAVTLRLLLVASSQSPTRLCTSGMLLVCGLNIPEHNRTVHDWLDATKNRLSMIALWRHKQDLLL